MANISFNADGRDRTKQESDKLIEELKQKGAKTNLDAYEQMMAYTREKLDSKDVRAAGGDEEALEASFKNIRSQFLAMAQSKTEIITARDDEIAEIRRKAAAETEAVKASLEEYKDKAALALSNAETAMQEAERAKEDAASARMQAQASQALTEAKDEKIEELREQLEAANSKLKGYDALKEERDSLAKQLSEAANDAEKERLRTELEAQKTQEELRTRIASLEAEVKILREFQVVSAS